MNLLPMECVIAFNSLRRVPGFSVTVITTLSITIAALLIATSLNYLLLVKPLPYPDEASIFRIDQIHQINNRTMVGSDPRVQRAWQENPPESVDNIALAVERGPAQMLLEGKSISTYAYMVTSEYFALFGTPLAAGRAFTEEEARGASPVILISEYHWRTEFNASADTVGSAITLIDGFSGERKEVEIIGVVADSFVAPSWHQQPLDRNKESIWLPYAFNEGFSPSGSSGVSFHSNAFTYAKLKAGTDLPQLQSQLSAIKPEAPSGNNRIMIGAGKTVSIDIQSLRDSINGNSQRISVLALGASVLLLLIACVNVANLFFSRIVQVQPNLAIKAALGARPRDLFTGLWVECLLLCGAASAIGLLLAAWGLRLIEKFGGASLPRLAELELDPLTLGGAILLTLSLAGIFAYSTLRMVNYRQLNSHLHNGGKGAAHQVSGPVLRLLVGCQVALAGTLLIAAITVMAAALRTINYPINFDIDNLYSLSVVQNARPAGGRIMIDNLEAMAKEQQQQSEKIIAELKRGIPNATISQAPLDPISDGNLRGYSVTDDSGNEHPNLYSLDYKDASFFDTIGLNIVAGRNLTQEEITAGENLMLVSESAAKLLSPNASILGRTFTISNPLPILPGQQATVVGVVEDVLPLPYKDSATNNGALMLWVNASSIISSFLHRYILRMPEGKVPLKSTLDTAIQRVDSGLTTYGARSLEEARNNFIGKEKTVMRMTLALTAVTLLLAAAGIYGVLSYNSQMRRFDFGIRLAMGAKTAELFRQVARHFILPMGLGLGLSILAAFLLYSVAQQHIAQWLEIDWRLLAAGLLLLAATVFIACFIPFRRVLKNNPALALRAE